MFFDLNDYIYSLQLTYNEFIHRLLILPFQIKWFMQHFILLLCTQTLYVLENEFFLKRFTI